MSGIIGLINVSAATVGASEVKSIRAVPGSGTTRATLLTPTSGKRVRILSVNVAWDGQLAQGAEVYFGTGANIGTTPANAIYNVNNVRQSDAGFSPNSPGLSWPDGAGPVGAVDAVLSIRNEVSASAGVFYIVHYREE